MTINSYKNITTSTAVHETEYNADKNQPRHLTN